MTATTISPAADEIVSERRQVHEGERQELARNGAGRMAISPRQEEAAILLAAGYTVSEVAREVGAGTRTIFRWLKQESFQGELSRIRERHRHTLEARVFSVAQEATVVVQQALRSDEPERQLTAAKLALNAAVRIVARYRERQVEGGEQPRTPLVVFPPGTRWPWQNRDVPTPLAPLEVESTDCV